MLFQRLPAFALSLLLALLPLAEASAGFLQVIKSTTTQANFIIYNPQKEADAQVTSGRSLEPLYHYKQEIWKNQELKRFVPLSELDFPLGTHEKTSSKKPQVLLLANASASDAERTRLENAFIRPFAKMGADVYMLPIAAAQGLSSAEKAEFFDLLSAHFDLMISNGGDDVHPALYNEKVTHSVDINQERDRAESEVIRAYIDRARGFFYGVCRGMQLAAVTYGMKMYQDIPTEVGSKVAHGGNGFRFHEIRLQATKNSLLKKMIGGNESMLGFSWHHQAVKSEVNAMFDVAGADVEDQFPEVLESKNGKALLTQFHPEYSRRVDALGMTDAQGAGLQILQGVFNQAQLVSKTKATRACHQVLL